MDGHKTARRKLYGEARDPIDGHIYPYYAGTKVYTCIHSGLIDRLHRMPKSSLCPIVLGLPDREVGEEGGIGSLCDLVFL
jgi:hypothetical protein